MHPHKFALWLFMVSIVMIFASMTSAFIVKRSDGGWPEFELPEIFWINSGIIIASSVFMQLAYFSAKKNNLKILKWFLAMTILLGLVFLYAQWKAWGILVENDIYLVSNNVGGTFLYILTGLHGIHLITGIIFLIIVMISTLQYKVHSKSLVRIEMCTTYWHFLGGLWIYLFVFLLFYH